MLLAGDIGGTKTDLAICSSEKGARSPRAQGPFRSADYLSLEAIVQEFLTKINTAVDRVCFPSPGPYATGGFDSPTFTGSLSR
jgi:glucokinase